MQLPHACNVLSADSSLLADVLLERESAAVLL